MDRFVSSLEHDAGAQVWTHVQPQQRRGKARAEIKLHDYSGII